jgi:hypothetical protein
VWLQEITAAANHAAKAKGSSTAASSSGGWGSSISSMLDDLVDPSTLAVCGVLLGACASALLVLGAGAYIRSRQQ